jgi:hypothetical protein
MPVPTIVYFTEIPCFFQREKPKFYEEYCRKKIEISRVIGLISS